MTWKVPYMDLGAQYQSLKGELDEAMQRVMASGKYTSGPETERFEEAMARYLGVKHVVGCGNGYDALYLALRAVGVGKSASVITGRYTHISTHAAIKAVGAIVRFKEEMGERTRAVLPIHMNGRMANIETIHADAIKNDIALVEDACQAIGASFNGRKAGTWGHAGCFSLHPMKILGCAGDGGFIATQDSSMDAWLRDIRNHGGGKGYGVNSRLDNIQAAILNVKLPHLDKWIARRREIAAIYERELPAWVKKPPAPSDGPYFDTYSSYVIGGSPELLAHMRDKGIECFSHIRTDVVSLPIYPEMKDAHIAMVVAAVKSYTNG